MSIKSPVRKAIPEVLQLSDELSDLCGVMDSIARTATQVKESMMNNEIKKAYHSMQVLLEDTKSVNYFLWHTVQTNK